MTTAEKAEQVFQSGLGFRIWNKPVQFDQIWDIRLFWMETIFHTDEDSQVCPKDGFKNIDDCLDNMLEHLENFKTKE